MLPRRCNIIKAIIRAVRVAPVQLIMLSLAKQFTAPPILPYIKFEKLGTDANSVYILQTPWIIDLNAIVKRKRP